jgi:ABC-type glutathione transport system ATPase component
VLTIGHQIAEACASTRASRQQGRAGRAVEMLKLVRIPDAERAGSTTTRTSSRAACASG